MENKEKMEEFELSVKQLTTSELERELVAYKYQFSELQLDFITAKLEYKQLAKEVKHPKWFRAVESLKMVGSCLLLGLVIGFFMGISLNK